MEIGEKRFLFQLYYEMDIDQVVLGGPYIQQSLTCDSQLMLKEDTEQVPLFFIPMQVQIHDLSPGLISEVLARQFGNFIRKFLKSDSKAIAKDITSYMRIRVQIDVRVPLKRRRKKIVPGEKRQTYAKFKYEHQSLFCFLCGRLSSQKKLLSDANGSRQ